MILRTLYPLGRSGRPSRPLRSSAAKGFLIAFVAAILIGSGLLPAGVVNGQASGIRVAVEPKVVLRLDARTVLQLHERFRNFADDIPAAETWKMDEVLAFEENPYFAYLRGCSTKVMALSPGP